MDRVQLVEAPRRRLDGVRQLSEVLGSDEMPRRSGLLCAVLVLAPLGCSGASSTCTMVTAGAGLRVDVVDATTTTPICDAQVTVSDGVTSYAEMGGGPPCTHSFGVDYPGGGIVYYTATVTAAGYQPAKSDPVAITWNSWCGGSSAAAEPPPLTVKLSH